MKMNKESYNKEWRRKNPDYHREWKKRNPEKVKALKKKWVKENPEKVKIIFNNWRKRNPDYKSEWVKRNPKKYKINNLNGIHNYRFGKLREAVLKRDNWQCQHCGMTNKEHIKKYGRSITIDHKDGNGRYSENPNNDIDNLITLCLKCHGSKDGKLGGRPLSNLKIFELKGGYTQ
jgi:5-methylcytosine-specific restriction endonuclease McrA